MLYFLWGEIMNQIKIGRFIAELRHQKGLTQEALGQHLGVTNKTISRWENGNYMPDIEMLKLLSEFFDVSINEILAGERLSNEEFKKKADENIVSALDNSLFSVKEREKFWKDKWKKDHISLFVCLIIVDILLAIYMIISDKTILLLCIPMLLMLEKAYLYNRMMIYVENNLYGCLDKDKKS